MIRLYENHPLQYALVFIAAAETLFNIAIATVSGIEVMPIKNMLGPEGDKLPGCTRSFLESPFYLNATGYEPRARK